MYLVAVDLLDASGGPTDVLSGCRSIVRRARVRAKRVNLREVVCVIL